MIRALEEKLRFFHGPLTEELIREPGKYGLGQLPSRMQADQVTNSICGFCSTGCSLNLHLQEGRAVGVSPQGSYPVNLGMACPKGWEAMAVLDAEDRASAPLYRETRQENFEELDWKRAAGVFCDRMRQVQNQYGNDSVAFLSTGQIPMEEMALLGAFAKFEMGMLHGDGNTRQCMATSVRSYKESFGFDAPPYTYKDFEESDVMLFLGSNLCIAHPIMWQRVLRNPHQPEIIVVDPRRTETAEQATQHVPLKPKSDLLLFYGLAHELIEKGWVDKAFIKKHTEGFEDFAQHLQAYPLDKVSEACGVSVAELQLVAKKIAEGKRVSFWWTMGINQGYESTRTAQAIINLALMTGNIGRPGTGANSITGQCNAMGSRLFSNTTNLLGGHDFGNAEHRKKVAGILGMHEQKIPHQASWAYDQIIDGIEEGKIKALWVIATNGAHSWTDQARFRKLMDKLDFLVVQDMYHSTETAQMADLVLPAAGWGEKEGVLINSERRLGHIKKVRLAPGQAMTDFNILRLLAEAWGSAPWIRKWNSPAAAFQILKQLSEGQPCDFTGIEDERDLDAQGGIQWPCSKKMVKSGPVEQERRLFEDGKFYTKSEKAKFCFEAPLENPEPVNEEYPFELLTGRGTSAQWHTQTRTEKSETLKRLYPQELYVEMHPEDAEALLVEDGEQVMLASRRGQLKANLVVCHRVKPGEVFLPMHYESTNRLTLQVVDPYSRQPSYKSCAVKVCKLG